MPTANPHGYCWKQGVLELFLYIQPKAKQEGYDGIFDRYIKFRIAAPPIENKANQRLINIIAKLFAVPKRAVTLVRGNESRYKIIHIENPQKLPEWIASPKQPV